jgi:malonyl CoA-acyl carrier protein transacylase
MENGMFTPVAIVGVGAILPDAPNAAKFWENVKSGRYSVTEVSTDRWDPALYYDPDPNAHDKAYSKIGGWVRDFVWDPMKWRLAIPPRVASAMDDGQKWAIACTREALEDYGYPKRGLDVERTAVILGNAMAGERHYLTALRVYFPEYARELAASKSFASLPEGVRRSIANELHERMDRHLPEVTEDTMPGELSNCIAGRIANLFNMRGPNFVTDAACASAIAAINAAVEGLKANQFDAVITGGVDRNMGAPSYIKFCKVGALSATGSRPYAEGADGFVMGEGAAIFLMKRLADAEHDGDRIYAVLRGIGGSSDGKGKGITAPNPIGQKLCVERAWKNAGVSPSRATLIEGHGTSTRVGDVVEVQSISDVLSGYQLPAHSVALGSVKSNFGHLKSAAGAAGVLKTVLALHNKVLPPSIHCEHPNPDIDFVHSPLYVNSELAPWEVKNGGVRRAGVSAFGFGGTNFHAVFEEHVPGRFEVGNRKSIAVTVPNVKDTNKNVAEGCASDSGRTPKRPLRGICMLGAKSREALIERLRRIQSEAAAGLAPEISPPTQSDLQGTERVAIDYGDAAELSSKAAIAVKACVTNQPTMWKALRAQGIFHGRGVSAKVAFLYTGQGSQYVNMVRELRDREPIVAETLAEADRVMTPILGKPLTEFIAINQKDALALEQAENDLRQTAVTQPAVLTVDIAITRLLKAYGIEPDMAMGHSLGEYGALVASGALPFSEALEAVSARGREMTRVSVEDNGAMAAVFAPIADVEQILKTLHGYVVVANVNSNSQAVIGGATRAVEQAIQAFLAAGFNAVPLPVSHAFHTSIVAPASDPLRQMLRRLTLQSPHIPVISNVSGEFYPNGPGATARMIDILARQIASPVQFVRGLQKLYRAGARVFVEVGPKKALHGFADDVLGNDPDVLCLFTNHPKFADDLAFNQALCGLYAAGLGRGTTGVEPASYVLQDSKNAGSTRQPEELLTSQHSDHTWDPVVITGAALGLPGTDHVFDDGNVARILNGEQFIDVLPTRFRRAMLDKHITRLVKSDEGGPRFESIESQADVIKIAGRARKFDLDKEFGIPEERVSAMDRTTQLAIAIGIEAMRDAGIPLVMRYKSTTKGTQLPDRWGLPDALRDDTGVIFASAFPGYDAFAHEMSRYYDNRSLRERLALLDNLKDRIAGTNGNTLIVQEITRRIEDLESRIAASPYGLDRRFLLRALSMGHSQFADFIGARGPNTQLNAACASTTQAIGVAEDWIRLGRCSRVIIVSADDVTSDNLVEWVGAAFLASGAAATDEIVEDAALPFDRRRHGMVMGMGAAALVLESQRAARERGIQPICEVLSTITANSAFHATRLSIDHIGQVLEKVITTAESRAGIKREEIASETMFVSHETYTPARGGSASAEIHALRNVFGDHADQIVIANTKGFTGHAMGTGIEDVVAVKALETGCVPPVANFKEVDPELGSLNLSKGGNYPVRFALRLAAGFGSQISMALLHWVETKGAARQKANKLGYQYRIADEGAWGKWLASIGGAQSPDLEVVQRTLRIRDHRLAAWATDAMPKQGTVVSVPVLVESSEAVSKCLVSPGSSPAKDNLTTAQADVEPKVDIQIVEPVAYAESVKRDVMALVAEKTGYPVEMLDLDLDLEADLGVDTVKQAEVFAAVREIYGIARDPNLKLRDFPTLAHVIRFVHERMPKNVETATTASNLPADPAVAELPPAVTVGTGEKDDVKKRILALVVEKTGYPEEMLDLDLDLEADLGVDTVKQAEMFAAIREAYNIPRDPNLKLSDFPTLEHVIQFVYQRRPDLAVPATPPLERKSVVIETSATTSASTLARETPNENSVKEKILDIVAAKTGYPKDMLDLDLDLEADLGIDTVKQAEMFAEVRANYNIPRDPNLKLRDFPTLALVIKFAQDHGDKKPEMDIAKEPIADARSISNLETTSPGVPSGFEAANRIPRRIPVPRLRPPIGVCKATGVAIGQGKRIVLMPDNKGVAKALSERLTAYGAQVLVLDPMSGDLQIQQQIKTWLEEGSIQGMYWLPALDEERTVNTMSFGTWKESLRIRVKLLAAVARSLYQELGKSGRFLVCGTKLGGQHGYDALGALAPMGGAVVGFAKAYKREQPEALVKAVDFGGDAVASEIAQALVDETLFDPGAIEIGYESGVRWTVGLDEQPVSANVAAKTGKLDRRSVFVVTGAAGSIVSEIIADLASAYTGTFYLLDLAPEPRSDNPDLQKFVRDKESLKRDLYARIQTRGERPTPSLIERELAGLERQQAALRAIEGIQAAGGTAHYISVDLCDSEAVAAAINQIKKTNGRIDVLLHAAGMERSHALPDKDGREFDHVFDVKVDGWFNLLHAIGEMPLGACVCFSSIAGRFGNAGQTDYSSANDLLCKLTSNLRRTRPGTRGIAIDWTAWQGIGMASRGSIPKVMELAGIDMLLPEAGVPIVRRELLNDTEGEVVIANRLGALMQEFDSSGGLDCTKSQQQLTMGPMLGRLGKVGVYGDVTFATTLDPKSQPFLYDHKIDGVPELPGVMGIEAFAEASLCLLPGWHIEAIEDINFLAPFKFYRNEPRSLTIEVRFRPADGHVIAQCALLGERMLINQDQPQVTTHFTGRVRLSKQSPEFAAAPFALPIGESVHAEDIYKIFFHGPAYRVVDFVSADKDLMIGKMSGSLPANHVPPHVETVACPRLIELCFQTAGVWEIEEEQRFGLPLHVERILFSSNGREGGDIYAQVVRDKRPGFNARVVDGSGTSLIQLEGYRTVAVSGIVRSNLLKMPHVSVA